jgi:uncharacterized protein YegP (UPF0339 family)
MSARRKPRFEVVHVDGGFFVRFVGANGRIVWVTPGLYSKRTDALNAISLVTGDDPRDVGHGLEVTVWGFVDPDGLLEVRTVDERIQP